MLSKEEFEALSEKAQKAFVLDDESGEYVPAKDAKLKSTLDELDKKFKAIEQDNRRMNETLAEYETRKQKELEEARRKALEDAENANDVKAIKQHYAEREADIRKQAKEEARTEVEKEFREQQAKQRANSLADKIGLSLGVDKDAGEALADLIRPRIKTDPDTMQDEFYSADGSALGVDQEGFIKLIAKEARYARLVKAEVATSGGGGANGSAGGSASAKNPFKKGEHFNLTEQARILKEDPERARYLKQLAEG